MTNYFVQGKTKRHKKKQALKALSEKYIGLAKRLEVEVLSKINDEKQQHPPNRFIGELIEVASQYEVISKEY